MTKFREELKTICDKEWQKIKSGAFFSLMEKEFTKELYIKGMIQIFHYAKYNAINQSVATFAEDYRKVGLLRFALKHALEEVGHENMVISDLKAMGVNENVFDAKPMPATDALSGYLDSVALRGGVIPRLGYSFWSEDSYEQMAPLLNACKNILGLTENQLTFFVAHAEIDIKHAQDVHNAIDRWVITDEEKESVIQVAKTTLFLTGQIFESVANEYILEKDESRLSA
ncbi:MAG: hypothetical protein ACJA0E_000777 [Bermanella sp.]|jgi:hypothetical protein